MRELAADRHSRLFRAEAGDELVDPCFGSLICLREGQLVVQGDMGDGLDCPRQVIEHQKRVDQHPDAVRKVEPGSRRRWHTRFKTSDRLVGKIANRSAHKSREGQIGHLGSAPSSNEVRQRQ